MWDSLEQHDNQWIQRAKVLAQHLLGVTCTDKMDSWSLLFNCSYTLISQSGHLMFFKFLQNYRLQLMQGVKMIDRR